MTSDFKLPNPFKSNLNLGYFIEERYLDDIKNEDEILREYKFLFVTEIGRYGQLDRSQENDISCESFFTYRNFIIDDIRVSESELNGERIECIKFKITEPYHENHKEFEINRKIYYGYSDIIRYIKFIINYYADTKSNIDKLTNDCISTDLFYVYNQDFDTIVKTLNFSSFNAAVGFFTISISDFYDQYTLEVIENCILTGVGTEYFNFYFNSVTRESSRITFYNSNKDEDFFKAKIIFHLKKLYNIEDHIRYVLIKHGCV